MLLTGCKDFFVSNSGGGGGGGTTTNDAIYVGNATSTTLAGYSISSTDGSLSAVSGSPVSVGVNVTSMAITPSNSYLYAGSSNGVNIYVYSIDTAGVLTLGNSNSPVAANIIPASMKVDSTGQWLIVADAANQQIISYAINTSTGGLTSVVKQITFSDISGSPVDLVITPNNGYVYVSLGKAGVDIFALDSTTGALTYTGHLSTLGTSNADRGMAVDANSAFLFITETSTKGLRVLSIANGNSGALSEVSGSPFTTGGGPIAVAVDPTNTYVYVANNADSNISGFTLASSGVLTALGSSPYATGASPIDIAFDKSKTYLAVACSGSNPDLQTFKLDSTTLGKLDSVAKATTGKSSAAGKPVSLGVTHY